MEWLRNGTGFGVFPLLSAFPGVHSCQPHTATHITLSAPTCRAHEQLSNALSRSCDGAGTGKTCCCKVTLFASFASNWGVQP
eukprot:scaffold144401_cov18-Tisochrysis_lutea.AAC.1